jgi:hypothetical protein
MNLDWVDTVIEEIEECQRDGIHPIHSKLRNAGLLTGYRERDVHRIYVLEHLLNRNTCPQGIAYMTDNLLKDVTSEDYSYMSNYKFLSRYIKSNPEYFDLREPESSRKGNNAAYAKQKTIDLILGGITQKSYSQGTGNGGSLSGTNRACCQNLISKYTEVTDLGRRILANQLSSYVNRINEYNLYFEARYLDKRVSNDKSEIFRVPYETRFNSESRTNHMYARFNDALDYARDTYDNAVFFSLTSDPKRFDSIDEMADAISQNWNRLRSWMRYDSQNPDRPNCDFQYIKTLEFSEKGYPHLHVLAFDVPTRGGKPYLIRKGLLSNRWNELGQGKIVQMDALKYCDNLGDGYTVDEGFINYAEIEEASESDSADEIQSQTAGQYVGKYVSKTFGAIDSIEDYSVPSESDETGSECSADDEIDNPISTAEMAKIALYFATNKKILTYSQEFREHVSEYYDEDDDEDENDLSEFVRIEFLGCYRWGDEPYRLSVESEPLSLEWLNKHKISSSAPAENAESVPPPAEMSDFA